MAKNSAILSTKQVVKRQSLENDVDTSLKHFGTTLVKNTVKSFADIGEGIFEQFFTTQNSTKESDSSSQEDARRETQLRKQANLESRTIFSYRQIEEERQIRVLTELINQIKAEVKLIKQQNQTLLDEVKDIEKITFDSIPEKPRLYDIRFLEILLSLLRSFRARIGESKTWLQALISKKKKRGSLFAFRAKKQGTQYSLSQELQLTRAVQ